MGFDWEGLVILVTSLFLITLVIVFAVLVHIRQKRGLAGKPFKNPRLESMRLALNKLGQVVSVLFAILFVGALIVGIGQEVWKAVSSSGWIYHTERVFTDMNGQWLKGEQNSCLYVKPSTEQIAFLTCDTGEKVRNLPVRFYGPTGSIGTDKKPSSGIQWNCTRDGDVFSCVDSKPFSVQ
jgi:hypothetical protein